MKKKPMGLIALLLLIMVLLTACNYNKLTNGGSPEASSQPDVPQGIPSETPKSRIFIPAIQSGNPSSENAGTGSESQPFDPHVEIEASADNLKVGETLTLVARPVDINLPVYSLIVRDEGVQDAPPAANVTYENQVKALGDSSKVLEFISAEAQAGQATFILRAKGEGVTTVTIEASGEIQNQTGSPATVSSGAGSILITVVK